MVIDDLADRAHDCDLLLDQNFYENLESRYDGLVPPGCKKLLGPKYALLRPEFREARKNLRKRDGHVRRIMIFFGGSDPSNETGKALEAIRMLNRPDIAVDVVVGAFNPHRKVIEQITSDLSDCACHFKVEDMAALMAKADLAVGAGGSTVWERCALALPSIIITVAENQERTISDMAESGYLLFLGRSETVSIDSLYHALEIALQSQWLLISFAKKTQSLVDGRGADRIVLEVMPQKMEEKNGKYIGETHHSEALLYCKPSRRTRMPQREHYQLRSMEETDLEEVLEWRNSERVRANMYTDHIITMDEHQAWFERIKQDQSVIYIIFEFQGRPVGVVDFTDIDPLNNKCYWGFYLGATDVPRGSGAAMEFLAIEHVFERMNIRKLCCEIFAFNSNVIKLHKKFGFVEDGCFTKHILKNGKYEDVISMACFKEEWLNLKDKLGRLCFGKGKS